MGIEVIGKDKPLCWTEFLQAVNADRQLLIEKENRGLYRGNWVYRGQQDAEWTLETTLERYYKDELIELLDKFNVRKYYFFLLTTIPSLNTFLGKILKRFALIFLILKTGIL